MYTQKYPQEQPPLRLPENYAGNAISQTERISVNTADIKKPSPTPESALGDAHTEVPDGKNPWESEGAGVTEAAEASATPASLFGGGKDGFGGFGKLFEKLSLPSIFGKRKLFDEGWLSRIGIEEIMLVAVAALLFFSKNGDKECALMLLLLLFID